MEKNESKELDNEVQEEVVVPGEEIDKQEKVEVTPKVDDINWNPKTEIGKKVKNNELTDLDVILDRGEKLLEAEIIDKLLPEQKTELLLVGQAKGKFGGGQRRVFMQTQKKTREGNKPKFSTYAVIGDSNGHIGLGKGKAKETVPAREKAIRNAKLGIIKIRRGCGSWQCNCKTPHSIPYSVTGKNGGVELTLLPAPKGTGLRVEKECQKILELAGIQDCWSKLKPSKTKVNLIKACMNALKKITTVKISPKDKQTLAIVEGFLPKEVVE